jgi:hypothetical protein
MRRTALLLVIAVYGYAANAQLTLRPQVGFEVPTTKISYNNLPSFKPECQSAAQFGLRADYQFKGGFGPFIGVFTHQPLVTYNFTDPEAGMTSYTAEEGDRKVQLQAGLQYSTKPIALNKQTTTVKANPESVSETKSGCRRYSSGCHKKSNETQNSSSQKSVWTVRLQPSAGLAYLPSSDEDIETINSGTQTSYTYNAGNIKTEFIAGLGFEFARNKTKFLSLSVNYFKGLGNNETILTTQSSGKTVTTTLNSNVSGWNASIGIPISFSKGSSSKSAKSYHKCGEYYKTRCGGYKRI